MTDQDKLSRAAIPTSVLTPELFLPFGQVLEAQVDGDVLTPAEAALDLSAGTPRFSLMQLRGGRTTFTGITRHLQVTQCLASVGGLPWLLAVAPAGGESAATDPALADIVGFEVPGHVAVLLGKGTWHAGPYFAGATMAFFNLELVGTNRDDHETSRLDQRFGVECFFAFAFGEVSGPP